MCVGSHKEDVLLCIKPRSTYQLVYQKIKSAKNISYCPKVQKLLNSKIQHPKTKQSQIDS